MTDSLTVAALIEATLIGVALNQGISVAENPPRRFMIDTQNETL